MNGLTKYIKTDKILKLSIVVSGILLITEIIYTGFFFFSLPPFIPLFNQLPWGEARLGSRWQIFLPILITCGFLITNIFLINYLYEKMPLVSRIIGITTLLITVLSFIFTLQTLQIIL